MHFLFRPDLAIGGVGKGWRWHPHYEFYNVISMVWMTKFGPEKQKAFCELLAQGVRRQAAAKKVGIVPETYRRHMKEDTEFKAMVDEAEMEANELVENALFNSALEGNFNAQRFWLVNKAPERWSDKQNVKITNDGESILRVDVSNIFDDIKRLAFEYEQRFNEARGLAAAAVLPEPGGDQGSGLDGGGDSPENCLGERVHSSPSVQAAKEVPGV